MGGEALPRRRCATLAEGHASVWEESESVLNLCWPQTIQGCSEVGFSSVCQDEVFHKSDVVPNSPSEYRALIRRWMAARVIAWTRDGSST
jgi:hypothetical protein